MPDVPYATRMMADDAVGLLALMEAWRVVRAKATAEEWMRTSRSGCSRRALDRLANLTAPTLVSVAEDYTLVPPRRARWRAPSAAPSFACSTGLRFRRMQA